MLFSIWMLGRILPIESDRHVVPSFCLCGYKPAPLWTSFRFLGTDYPVLPTNSWKQTASDFSSQQLLCLNIMCHYSCHHCLGRSPAISQIFHHIQYRIVWKKIKGKKKQHLIRAVGWGNNINMYMNQCSTPLISLLQAVPSKMPCITGITAAISVWCAIICRPLTDTEWWGEGQTRR